MFDTKEKLLEENLENLYQKMLKNIISYMDEKKLTLKDLCSKMDMTIEQLEDYFSLKKSNFSVYDEILKIVKEW